PITRRTNSANSSTETTTDHRYSCAPRTSITGLLCRTGSEHRRVFLAPRRWGCGEHAGPAVGQLLAITVPMAERVVAGRGERADHGQERDHRPPALPRWGDVPFLRV